MYRVASRGGLIINGIETGKRLLGKPTHTTTNRLSARTARSLLHRTLIAGIADAGTMAQMAVKILALASLIGAATAGRIDGFRPSYISCTRNQGLYALHSGLIPASVAHLRRSPGLLEPAWNPLRCPTVPPSSVPWTGCRSCLTG
jgi:hypothetical protein